MRLNKDVESLRVGMEVTSDYIETEEDIIRVITEIHQDSISPSGYKASASGGYACSCCGTIKGRKINNVGASWFLPIVNK